MMLASPLSLTDAQHNVASSSSTGGIPPGQHGQNIDISPSVLPNKRTRRRKRLWFDDDSEEAGTNVNRTYYYCYYIID